MMVFATTKPNSEDVKIAGIAGMDADSDMKFLKNPDTDVFLSLVSFYISK